MRRSPWAMTLMRAPSDMVVGEVLVRRMCLQDEIAKSTCETEHLLCVTLWVSHPLLL
jgi:hypothetical protein